MKFNFFLFHYPTTPSKEEEKKGQGGIDKKKEKKEDNTIAKMTERTKEEKQFLISPIGNKPTATLIQSVICSPF